jgi:5-formaminoimidazole-4-carboxamide-1-(beta)-D-ribofuranosyl 5'-monophosphate synthetase
MITDVGFFSKLPHGSFVAYLGVASIEKAKVGFFGNRRFLKWETTFELQDKALDRAGFRGQT